MKALYLSADAADQRLLKVASEQVGRQPVRRSDGSLAWEPLLDAETVTRTVLTRADRYDEVGAVQLRDLTRIRNSCQSFAASARQLVEASLKSAVA